MYLKLASGKIQKIFKIDSSTCDYILKYSKLEKGARNIGPRNVFLKKQKSHSSIFWRNIDEIVKMEKSTRDYILKCSKLEKDRCVPQIGFRVKILEKVEKKKGI